MPRPTKGKRLGGSPSHEDQIISNLIRSLIQHEKIETTITKAKVVKPYAEKVITKAKKRNASRQKASFEDDSRQRSCCKTF